MLGADQQHSRRGTTTAWVHIVANISLTSVSFLGIEEPDTA